MVAAMKVLKILMAIVFGLAAVITFPLLLFGVTARIIVGMAHKIKCTTT